MIVKYGNKWILKSQDGSKVLGVFDTRAQAEKRESEIKMLSHMKKR
jgi:hypothetical protein